jgi:hypothetical protein
MRLGLMSGSVGDGASCHPRHLDLVGDGPGPIPVQYHRPLRDRDGNSAVSDDVLWTESRPWDIVGDGASPIPVLYWPSVVDVDGSWPIPGKFLGSGMPAAPSPNHNNPFLKCRGCARAMAGNKKQGLVGLCKDFAENLHLFRYS